MAEDGEANGRGDPGKRGEALGRPRKGGDLADDKEGDRGGGDHEPANLDPLVLAGPPIPDDQRRQRGPRKHFDSALAALPQNVADAGKRILGGRAEHEG